jgi:DNA uptake protein ComE-like DNA-binding protein
MLNRFRLFIVLVFAVFAASAVTLVGAQDATPEATAEGFTRFNLNTATGDDFLTIPDMNNRMVREYMEYRPYVSILQFRKEIGKYVGDEQVAGWEPYIYVPIQIDQADVETLKQIPGVDDTIANELIAGRPYTTNDAFLAKLASFLTPEQVGFAQNFLEGYSPEATATPAA